MRRPIVAVFAMAERGHFKRMRSIIHELSRAGAATHVFTHSSFKDEVEHAGGSFVDMFAALSVDEVDAASIPVPCRFVTFAARAGREVASRVAALRPGLVIHDTFAVIGQVVANLLALPRINICAGHNVAPGPTLAALKTDPRVRIAEVCWQAAELLRTRYGISDASPFSYVTGTSSDLNVYCEPPQFLHAHEREPFQPLVFFGSLWPAGHRPSLPLTTSFRCDSNRRGRLYASVGTIVWRYYAEAARHVLESLSEAARQRTHLDVVIGLGGAAGAASASRLTAGNIQVAADAPQWELLRDAAFYLTHHGLNSTHEAIYHRVPMLSYPFFADQPGLARRCQELGLAVPTVAAVRGAVTAQQILSAIDRIDDERRQLDERLAVAREWEMATIAARPAAVDRMLSLTSSVRRPKL